MDSTTCFMCGQKSAIYHPVSDTKHELQPSLSHIICQHFWFGEYELRTANICESCRVKVDEFHRFYQEVKKHHEGLLLESQSFAVFIKQEEIEIDEEPLQEYGTKAPEEAGELLDGGCKVEVVEECNKLPDGTDNVVADGSSKIRKQTPTETKSKRTSRMRRVGRKRELAEDNSIKLREYGTKAPDEAGEPLEEGCKVRVVEECNKLPDGTDNVIADGSSKTRKQTPTETKSKRPRLSRMERVCRERELEREDNFIKQHRPYYCDECTMQFESFVTIRRHTARVHEKNYIMCCNAQWINRKQLYEHVQYVLDPEVFKCDICNKKFRNKNSCITHKLRWHPSEEQLIFKCNRCPKMFAMKVDLTRHTDEHKTLENQEAKCPICGRCFGRSFALKSHIEVMHNRNKNFVCEICSEPFVTRPQFLKHRLTHDFTAEQLKKQCPVCNIWKKNQAVLNMHMTRHKNEGTYKCDQCEHVSITPLALKEHAARRHGPKKRKFVCDLCGKEYSQAVTLKEHIANAHTGKPLYECPYCDRKFFSNASMYAHRKKGHPEEWLKRHNAKYASKEEADATQQV